jgi:hypothetical protein
MNPPPAAGIEEQIGRYLDQIAADLHGPRRRRARILAELREGLVEAVAGHTARGLPPRQAVVAATAQFGSPAAVAASFAGELTIGYARRTLGLFVATGPLVGIPWLLVLHPDPWRTGLVATLDAIPVVPLIAVAVTTAVSTLATTGRLMRWLPEASPQHALAATLAVALLAVVCDAAIIGIYLLSGIPARQLTILAIALSLARITVSLIVARHTTTAPRPRRS